MVNPNNKVHLDGFSIPCGGTEYPLPHRLLKDAIALGATTTELRKLLIAPLRPITTSPKQGPAESFEANLLKSGATRLTTSGGSTPSAMCVGDG